MNALITNMDNGRFDLAGLSDAALLAGTRRLVAGANHTLAALLAHLADVEARGIHRVRACASLYTYCIYELRMSEDAAFRRAKAARLCRRFPALYDCVAAGELHLTGLLMLGPHLTDDNLADVLARAKHRTKRELQKLVRELDPLPDVPARIEPLGPELASPRNPTWNEFVASFAPVRELAPGERPADWLQDTGDVEDCSADAGGADAGGAATGGAETGADNADAETGARYDGADTGGAGGAETSADDADASGDGVGAGDMAPAPAPARPQRYKVQFTATQEYVDLLERARDLLAHALPHRSIEAVHLRALRELVARLEKKRCAATDKPRPRGGPDEHPPRQREGALSPELDPRRHVVARAEQGPRQRGADSPEPDPRRRVAERAEQGPRQRDTIPAAVRRSVWERDGARCSYVDERGQRCRETALLELHHEMPFARGGPASADNLRLRCRAHNALAAEQDFGREFMERMKPTAPDG